MNTESYPLPKNSHETEIHYPSNENSAAESAKESAARGPGRPSRRTPELEATIFECLQIGLTIAETCDVCGVSETQFRSWRQHYPDFAAMVRRGQAEAVKTHLAIIREAAGKRWQASAWWLERRCPQRWGKTERRTFEDIRISDMDEEVTEEMIQALREHRATIDELRLELEKAKAGPAVSESKPGVSIAAGVSENAAGLEDDCEDLEIGAGNEPGSEARHPAEEPEIVESPASQPATPPPCSEEPLHPAPCAVKTPTVFIGGARNGEAAEYDEANSSTHEQDGYRLSVAEFDYEERSRHLKVLGDPGVQICRLGSEAGRLLLAGTRAVAEALAAQERSASEANGRKL